MILDTLTIFICCSIVFLAIVTIFINIYIRSIRLPRICGKVYDQNETKVSGVKFSIVITAQDNELELEKNLPALFAQNYEPGFEVIVVTGKSDDETDTVIKNLQKEHSNLHTTFIPDSSRYMSRMKLAVTLGVKAAKNEWIILLSPECKPQTDQWLKNMSRHCSDNKNIVLCYSNYDNQVSKYYRFWRLYSQLYSIREALGKRAYCSTGSNVCFRKSVFMKHNGFLKNLKYERGEFDFIVNEYSEDYSTDVAIEEESHLVIDNPSNKSWINEQMYYMDTRRHLARKIWHRIKFDTDMFIMHFNYIAEIAIITYFGIFHNWIGLGVSVFALICSIIIRTIVANKVIKFFDDSINILSIIPFELRIIWTQLYLKLRYLITDKKDFIRK